MGKNSLQNTRDIFLMSAIVSFLSSPTMVFFRDFEAAGQMLATGLLASGIVYWMNGLARRNNLVLLSRKAPYILAVLFWATLTGMLMVKF
jgi:hypothetical protein